MRIAVGNDHAGHPLRSAVLEVIESLHHEVIDFGTSEPDRCDYPDYAQQVAVAVRDGRADLGVLMCGTGIGMAIAANKVSGVNAALCHDTYSARLARSHNAATIIAMGGRVIGPEVAKEVLAVFLQTQLSPEPRHRRRRAKVDALAALSSPGPGGEGDEEQLQLRSSERETNQ